MEECEGHSHTSPQVDVMKMLTWDITSATHPSVTIHLLLMISIFADHACWRIV